VVDISVKDSTHPIAKGLKDFQIVQTGALHRALRCAQAGKPVPFEASIACAMVQRTR